MAEQNQDTSDIKTPFDTVRETELQEVCKDEAELADAGSKEPIAHSSESRASDIDQLEQSQESKRKKPSVAQSTALMSLATLISRITGLGRSWAMAFALGNTYITSAYQVANNMPNVVFDLVAGGLLGAAFIPIYLLEKEKKGIEKGNDFACNLLNITIVILGALTLLSSFFAPQLIATQTFTLDTSYDVVSLSVAFFRIFAFQIIFYGISGIVTAVLNANRVYFLPAIAPAVNNICVIASFIAFIPLSYIDLELGVIVLGVATTLGVALQAIVQIPALLKMGFKYKWCFNLKDPALKEAMKIALPTMLYIVGTLVAFSFRNAFSLLVSDRGPSTLLYAWTWFQLPYGVVAVSLSRALFTEMGEAYAQNKIEKLRELVHSGISGTLLLIIPLAGIMITLSTPLMELFRAGAFEREDVYFVSRVLAFWLLALPFYSILMFMYNVYASVRKFMTFALVSTILVVVQCYLYYATSHNLGEDLVGIVYADLVYYALCSIVLVIIFIKQFGSINLKQIMFNVVKITAATLLSCFYIFIISEISFGIIFEYFLNIDIDMISGIVRLSTCGAMGVFLAFGLCYLFKVPGMEIVTKIVNKIKRKVKR